MVNFVHFVYCEQKGQGDYVFYDNYIKLCSKKGMSPSAVAVECGIAKASVTRWKNGAIPFDKTLYVLADYFKVSIDDLLEDNKTPAAQGDGLSDELRELINLWDNASPERRKLALDLLRLP